MKSLAAIIFSVISVFSCFAACNNGNTAIVVNEGGTENTSNAMRITIGTHTFAATLYDNATAAAFKTLLPMTISMSELNGNEKYFYLPNSLPTNVINPGTIQSGDLMIYGSNYLVVFYQTFSSSYSYTKLGRIDNPAELAAAVGNGSVMVSFELVNSTTAIEESNADNEYNFKFDQQMIEATEECDKLILYNLQGSIIRQVTGNRMYLTNLHAGTYMVRVEIGNIYFVRKIILFTPTRL